MSSKSASKPPVDPKHVHEPEHDDDLIVAPKGKSKMQFLMILGLMVFTLIVFVIPGSFQAAFQQGSPVGETVMSWKHPDGRTIEVDYLRFIDAKRRIDEFFRLQRRRTDIEDDDVATFLVLDELARSEGLGVSNQEVANAILSGFGQPGSNWSLPPIQSKETYDQLLAFNRLSAPRFEETLRQILRVERYKAFVTAAASWPNAADVEASWKEENQEYAYEYVEIPTADFLDEAGQRVPSDEELTTWYDELPTRQTVFREDFRQEKVAAELVGIRASGEEDGAGLLAKFPRPDDEDAAELAQTYYDEVAHRRFVRPEPLEDEEDARKRLYFEFDEVKDVALREAPLQRAMTEWLQDLSQRAADGEELDLATEAADLGLYHVADGTQREHQEWNELDELGGPFLASALRSAGPNGLTLDVCADKGGLFVGFVTDRTEAGLPPFDEIRDRVVEEWTANEAGEVALEVAKSLRTSLAAAAGGETTDDGADGDPTTEDPTTTDKSADDDEEEVEPITVDTDVFKTVAEAAGWSVGTRDWLAGYGVEFFDFQGQRIPIPKSPLDKDPNGENPANKYIAGAQALEDLEVGGVSEAGLDTDREHAYLVRALGSRDPVEMHMSRDAWNEARAAAVVEKRIEFEERFFGHDRLAADYALVLDFGNEDVEGELNAEEEDAGEGGTGGEADA